MPEANSHRNPETGVYDCPLVQDSVTRAGDAVLYHRTLVQTLYSGSIAIRLPVCPSTIGSMRGVAMLCATQLGRNSASSCHFNTYDHKDERIPIWYVISIDISFLNIIYSQSTCNHPHYYIKVIFSPKLITSSLRFTKRFQASM